MKKLFKVETNASTMFITYDYDEKIVMCLDNIETNDKNFDLKNVEDDSSWDKYENIVDLDEWLGDDCTVLEEIDFI